MLTINNLNGFSSSAANAEPATAGFLFTCGDNREGQLGLGFNSNPINVFTQVFFDQDWVQISAGSTFLLARKSDGTIWGTGNNGDGQLGLGDKIDRNTLTQIGTDSDWIFIAAGSSHSLAIKDDFTLYSTGANASGGLGQGNTTLLEVFTQVGTDTDWTSCAGGTSFSVALKSDGTLFSTGSNVFGQLAQGDEDNLQVFTQENSGVNTWEKIAISSLTSHVMAMRTDNTIWGAGNNVRGQLGLGTETTVQNIYIQEASSASDWTDITAGSQYSIALKTTTMYSTGRNDMGQLGQGNTTDLNVFTLVGTDTNWSLIAAGSLSSFSIKTTGLLWATGDNRQGTLGLGNNEDVLAFTNIPSLNSWSTVVTGGSSSYAITS